MTIKEKILSAELARTKERKQKLSEIGSPKIILERLTEIIAELESGKIHVSGDIEALNEPYLDGECKKGRGGVPYISYNNGTINFFPNARYGMYIKYTTKK